VTTAAKLLRRGATALASARPIAITHKPPTRRPRGGTVKEILNQSPAGTPSILGNDGAGACATPLAMNDRAARYKAGGAAPRRMIR